MPSRIIREAILSSERMAMLGWAEEVFYRRLMSIVDDYGRFEANPLLLRSKCYPLQTDSVRAADISRSMAACQKAGLIVCYEVNGKQYLEISNFGQQQRTASKFPPPQAFDINCNQISANAHLGVDVSVVEDVICPNKSDGFARFWECWPSSLRKGAKQKCLDLWIKKNLSTRANEIIAHVEASKVSADWQKDGGCFIPMPSTYLGQGRWDGAQIERKIEEFPGAI